jgi:mannose-6-phosphate isomerase-like protein (cupin superfamily)
MSYGLSFRDVSLVRTPAAEEASWGSRTVCTLRPEYGLERLFVRAQSVVPACFYPKARGVYYVESGALTAVVRGNDATPSFLGLDKGSVLNVPVATVHGFRASAESVIYFFSEGNGPERRQVDTQGEADRAWRDRPGERVLDAPGHTSDFREKYWGTIETVVDDNFAGKRIFIRSGGQSSLEFHTTKVESYFLHAGTVRVGLRTGRAENRSVVLSAGQSFDVVPGLMHMRIALADSVIIEVSTRDADSDSHLVEDGTKYTHIDVQD